MTQVVEALRSAGVGVEALPGAGPGAAAAAPAPENLRALRIAAVQHDSRAVRPGDLFVAWSGAAADAHDFVPAAAAAGAVAAIVERPVPGAALPQIRVDNARLAAAVAAGLAAGSPWRRLRAVGVTGTNGKTTTTLLLRELLSRREPAAAIGTLGVVGPDGRIDKGSSSLTTPGPTEIAERLASLVRAGTRAVALETSSHALDQHRLDGVRFDVMAFTNLTRDHLDYHGAMDRYLAAKARLLALGKDGAVAVINADDPAWRSLRPSGPTITYGLGAGAQGSRHGPRGGSHLRARNPEHSTSGSRFDLEWRGERVPAALPLPGAFNVSNALAAAACALALGLPLDEAAAGLNRASPVPGRLEPAARDPFDVLIDFAHTPDALDQLLAAMRKVVAGRLIVVFGAGGDRDPSKRALMGAAAARHADVAVVTSDNPRTENPAAIVAEVAAGAQQAAAETQQAAGAQQPASGPRKCRIERIVDRRAAIHAALDEAEPGDAVILAGKGHETVQIVGREKLPFDERAIVREHLDRRRGS